MNYSPKIEITWDVRTCVVGDEVGYFHTWEITDKGVKAIVEFVDKVRRVDPEKIQFKDDLTKSLEWAHNHPEEVKAMLANTTITIKEGV